MYFVQLRIAPQNPKTPELIINHFRAIAAFSSSIFLVRSAIKGKSDLGEEAYEAILRFCLSLENTLTIYFLSRKETEAPKSIL